MNCFASDKKGKYIWKCEWTVSGLVYSGSFENCTTCRHQGYFIKIYTHVYFTTQPMRIQIKRKVTV